MKKWISIILVMALVLSVTACGKKGEETSSQSGNDYSNDYVYREDIIDIDMGEAAVNRITMAGEHIYVYGTIYHYPEEFLEDTTVGGMVPYERSVEEGIEEETDTVEEDVEIDENTEATDTMEEDVDVEANTVEGTVTEEEALMNAVAEPIAISSSSGYTENIIGIFDLEGNLEQQFAFGEGYDQWVMAMESDSQGAINILYTVYGSEETDYMDSYYLANFNELGEENWKIQLGTDVPEESYFYISDLYTNENDELIVATSLGLEIYENDGTPIRNIEMEEEYGTNYIMLENGNMLHISWGETKQTLEIIDMETGEIAEQADFPFNTYLYTYQTGYGYDLYLTDNYGVYGYNVGEESITMIMNYIDSDINTYSLENITPVSETEFYATYYSSNYGDFIFAKFTKIPPEEVVEKEVLTLACMWLDSEIKEEVVRFNKTNEKYRISVTDYSTYNTGDDYTIGSTKLNTDIISGNVPDIMIMTQDSPVSNYIAKGILADLNPLFEADETLNKEDYLPNMLDTFSVDGGLYQIVPKFSMMTVIGKASDVGTTPGWTLDELEALLVEKGDGAKAFGDVSRGNVLYYAMMLCSAQYIDHETGECSFNTDGFKQLLTFVNSFPEEINYDDMDWENYQTQFRNGTTLLALTSVNTFRNYNMYEQGDFGEEITMIGFPTENENGSSINYSIGFSVSAKSKNQEGAWEFIRYFLTDEYQDNVSYEFPIKISSLEAQAKAAQEKEFYIDELTGEKIEYDESYWVGETELILEPISKEKCDKVMEALQSLNQVIYTDNSLMTIIEEEAAAYFSGQKTVDEVADIIQSRVQIYVNEGR